MNTEKYVTLIKVLNCGDIKHIDIPLNKDKRKHLIITGKNGSGKTSLLLKIEHAVSKGIRLTDDEIISTKEDIGSLPRSVYTCHGLGIMYNTYLNQLHTVYFGTDRSATKILQEGSLLGNAKSSDKKSSNSENQFMQYLVHRKFRQLLAMEDGDHETVKKTTDWFHHVENMLSQILGYKVTLKFNTKEFSFLLMKEENNSVLFFHQLPGGYYALVNILTSIIMRTDPNESAVVLIDEIETHLHVEFQKMILPLLVDFFPHIQFIVSTHSPFVVSSLSNAVICDLEKKIITEDLSGYGYDTLVESFFGTSLISDELKSKISRYDELDLKEDKTPEEHEEFSALIKYLTSLPKYLPNELSLKIKSIELSNRSK